MFFSVFFFWVPRIFHKGKRSEKKIDESQSLHLSSMSCAEKFGKGEADLRRAVACCQRSPFQEKEGTCFELLLG